jgi:prepilin-type processing-associated H-X9-DG protein
MAHRVRRGGRLWLELLVTASVVAALTGAAYPVLYRLRAGDRTQLCAANLRCLGRAIGLYAYEHDETYPITFLPKHGFCCWHHWRYTETLDAHITNDALYFWEDELGPNIASRAAIVCPADPCRGEPAKRHPTGTVLPLDRQRCSYSLVRCLSVADAAVSAGKTWPLQAHRLSDVRDPSRKILALEHEAFHEPGPRQWSGVLHADAAYNALFCDGHVKYVRYDDVLPSAKQDLAGFEHHDPNYTVGGMAGKDVP